MRNWQWFSIGAASAAVVTLGLGIGRRSLPRGVRGRPKSLKTGMLELGATLLQRRAPLRNFKSYTVGFHPLRDEPNHQMETHHFCHQVTEDFMQCILFDGAGPDARLNGIEYIISEDLFNTLPPEEQQYWHPHNFEILSGQLAAPGLPQFAEHALLKMKMNSYGKTWHVWDTHSNFPFGPARLAWSFNQDGEVDSELMGRRDIRMGIDTWDKRRKRQDLVTLAHPQCGVAAMAGMFGRETTPLPGVQDVSEARALPEVPGARR